MVRGAGRKNVIHEKQTVFSEIFIIHTRLNLLKRHSLSVTFMYILYIYILIIIIKSRIRISTKLLRVKRYIFQCVRIFTKKKRNFVFIKLYIYSTYTECPCYTFANFLNMIRIIRRT